MQQNESYKRRYQRVGLSPKRDEIGEMNRHIYIISHVEGTREGKKE